MSLFLCEFDLDIDTVFLYYNIVNSKHLKTLEAIFERLTRAQWMIICPGALKPESLLKSPIQKNLYYPR